MADVLKLDPLDRAWIKKALELQRISLVRARGKEIPGSEIDLLRGREIGQVDALLVKVA